jgi:hypothetical protein
MPDKYMDTPPHGLLITQVDGYPEDEKHGCIGSAVITVIAADAFGRGRAPAAAEVVLVYMLRRDGVGGPKDTLYVHK